MFNKNVKTLAKNREQRTLLAMDVLNKALTQFTADVVDASNKCTNEIERAKQIVLGNTP